MAKMSDSPKLHTFTLYEPLNFSNHILDQASNSSISSLDRNPQLEGDNLFSLNALSSINAQQTPYKDDLEKEYLFSPSRKLKSDDPTPTITSILVSQSRTCLAPISKQIRDQTISHSANSYEQTPGSSNDSYICPVKYFKCAGCATCNGHYSHSETE